VASDGQLTFNGLTIGDGTDYHVQSIVGLDDFDVRASDRVLPDEWGAVPGRDLVDAKAVTIDVLVPNRAALLAAFEAAFQPAALASAEDRLVWKHTGQVEMSTPARCRRRHRGRTIDTVGAVPYAVQLACPDPRRYAHALALTALAPTQAGTEALEYSAGAGADLAFDYSAGTGANLAFDYSGTVGVGPSTIRNGGTAPTYPQLLVFGPSTGSWSRVRLSNLTTGETLELATLVNVGELLIADMSVAAGYVPGDPIVVASGSLLAGEGAVSARYAAWQLPRKPWVLAPGDNVVTFEVLDGDSTGAQAWLFARDAYL
jgi:hypothetical protein